MKSRLRGFNEHGLLSKIRFWEELIYAKREIVLTHTFTPENELLILK